jgi:hypothetical protein
MKYSFSACIFCFAVTLVSCSKNDGIDSSTYISGRWNIVADSTYDGLGIANQLIFYKGQSGDYCDFNTHGSVDIKEGVNLNTSHYQVISNSSIFIDDFYGSPNDTAYIESLSTNDILISTHLLYTPGGIFGRTLHLTR